MFNWFKKNKETPENKIETIATNTIPKEPNRTLRIEFKNGKNLSYDVESEKFPYVYRKIINWYFARESKMYIFIYKNGQVIFNRDDILIIQTDKRS